MLGFDLALFASAAAGMEAGVTSVATVVAATAGIADARAALRE
jgi:hypothetical protein